MDDTLYWPSGDCKPVLATNYAPENLVGRFGITVTRGRDDLDGFDGATLNIAPLGTVSVMRHEGNPLRLTVLYVDAAVDTTSAQAVLRRYFGLADEDIAWKAPMGC